ncbi:hypothetical protein AHF37_01609 [Paragonimus kellicotti]|nr:hypothetical protein AHF37_01609 [Paragonimus kellicotti]
MNTSLMNTSVSFEIPLDEAKVKSPRTPRAAHLLGSPNRSVLCETDLIERLEKADQRRCNVLEREKVERVTVARSSPQKELMRQIYEDMSNKENKRRSYIQGIVEHCQHEVSTVGEYAEQVG